MLEHRAERDLAELLAVQAELLDQRTEGAHRHPEVADVGIGGVLPAEGNANAAEHGDGSALQHRKSSYQPGARDATGIMRRSVNPPRSRANHAWPTRRTLRFIFSAPSPWNLPRA